MRILIVNRLLGTLLGGGETFDLNVAQNLVKRNHNVTVITARPIFSRSLLTYPNLKFVYLPTLNLRSFDLKIRRINQTLGAICRYVDMFIFEIFVFLWFLYSYSDFQFDLVQCCNMFWLPKWILMHLNIPVVSWLPGPPPKLKQYLIRTLISQPHFGLFTHGEPVIVLENQLGLKRGIDFEVIEPGIDITIAEAYNSQRNIIRSSLNITDRTIVGVTVARLIPIKNFPFLIEGLARVVHNLKMPIIWFVIGDGPERSSIKRLIESKRLQDWIHCLGQVEHNKVHKFLAVADIFALTSIYENFSLAILEAMAHKLPIVATNVGYLKTLIQESNAGILVNLEDVEGLSRAIGMLVTNEQLRHQLGKNGRVYVQRYDWSNIVNKLLKFYENVIAGRSVFTYNKINKSG